MGVSANAGLQIGIFLRCVVSACCVSLRCVLLCVACFSAAVCVSALRFYFVCVALSALRIFSPALCKNVFSGTPITHAPMARASNYKIIQTNTVPRRGIAMAFSYFVIPGSGIRPGRNLM